MQEMMVAVIAVSLLALSGAIEDASIATPCEESACELTRKGDVHKSFNSYSQTS